jgi:H+/Cl- antiporter ClcA
LTADRDRVPSNAEPAPAIAPKAYLRLLLLGAVIGIPAAVMAVGFLAVVHQLEELLWHDLPDVLDYSSPPWFLVIGLPVVGAAIVALVRLTLPGDGGHAPLGGISVAPTAVAAAPGVALAAIATLSFGAVLGPEAPLIALGSAVGLAAGHLVRLEERGKAVISTAGSFSAISAIFGGPLPAGVLLIEAGVGMGAALIPLLLPGLVAAAIGYLIFIGIGDWGGLGTATLTVPGLAEYDATTAPDLLLAVAVGIVTALIVVGVRRLARALDGASGKRVQMPWLLIGGGLAVGLLAQLADVLGADSQDVLFSGQDSLPTLVTEGSAGVVIVLIAAKALAYGICLGCGFRGGPVFPAIFLGVAVAMLGADLFDMSATAAVAMGCAAGVAAATRLLIAALLIAALVVGTAGLDAVPAAVLAAAAAWLTVSALEPAPTPAAEPTPATAER